ncbi:hypothetical protein [Novosphingobium sp. HII-3]|uniref:hypothetical protein n=1 Tax=Novosphingobium sp. HII-3 TaxID=2075565 RepID=UPI001E35C839|nr:hypothetical protein [Novosphingobium sp. HII-3]
MKVQVLQTIDLPIERAWPVFSGFTALNDIMPGAAVEVKGSGVGAVRTMTQANGSKFRNASDRSTMPTESSAMP